MDLQMWGPVESGLIGAAVATVLTGVAFSHGQGAPLWVAFPPLAAGRVALCFGIAGLLRGAA